MITDERDYGFIEGYASALSDLELRLTGENRCSKSYDPMTVSEGIMHSYAFDLKDGGRHHPLSDYEEVPEVCYYLLEQTVIELERELP